MKASKGFTLIELVVVIVILGILAATALPKFIDLSSDAKSAALEGVAGAIESASAINYGGYSANSSKGHTDERVTCADGDWLPPLFSAVDCRADTRLTGSTYAGVGWQHLHHHSNKFR